MYEFIEDNKTTLLFLLLLLLGIASFLSNKNQIKKRNRIIPNNKYRTPRYIYPTPPKNNDISKEEILNIINQQSKNEQQSQNNVKISSPIKDLIEFYN